MTEIGFPKPTRKPKRATRDLDPRYIWWIHSYPCVICQRFPVHAHHVKSRGAGGSDRTCIPLCMDHHTGDHGIHHMGTLYFEKHFELDLGMEMKKFNDLYERGEKGPNFHLLPEYTGRMRST